MHGVILFFSPMIQKVRRTMQPIHTSRSFYIILGGLLFLTLACRSSSEVPSQTPLFSTETPPTPSKRSTPIDPTVTSPPSPLELTSEAIVISIFDGTQSDIYLMNSDGSNEIRLTFDPAYDSQPSWSPDGTRIAYTSKTDRGSNIYSMSRDGSDVTQLTTVNWAFYPAWSPDGTGIVFCSWNSEGTDLFVMTADGSNMRQLTHGGAAAGFRPTWSPDGSYIAFIGVAPNDSTMLYVINADGSNLTPLPETQTPSNVPIYAVDWSPNGRYIAYVVLGYNSEHPKTQIYLLDVSGKTPIQTFAGEEQGLLDTDTLVWSPDGSRILVQNRIGPPVIFKADGSISQSGISNAIFQYKASSPDWFIPGIGEMATTVERPTGHLPTSAPPTPQTLSDLFMNDPIMSELAGVCEGIARPASPAYMPGNALHPLAAFLYDDGLSEWRMSVYHDLWPPSYSPGEVQLVACINWMSEFVERCNYSYSGTGIVQRSVDRTRLHAIISVYEASTLANIYSLDLSTPPPLPAYSGENGQ